MLKDKVFIGVVEVIPAQGKHLLVIHPSIYPEVAPMLGADRIELNHFKLVSKYSRSL